MSLLSDNIESISTTPDEELSSLDQIDIYAVGRALARKSTYKAYKALLVHRRTLQCLQTNVDLTLEKANEALSMAVENIRKTEQAIANICDSPMYADPTTPPPIAYGVLTSILALQKFYYTERFEALRQCAFERGRVLAFTRAVDKRVEKVQKALVKKFGIVAVDDEGVPLELEEIEQVFDLLASIPGYEKL